MDTCMLYLFNFLWYLFIYLFIYVLFQEIQEQYDHKKTELEQKLSREKAELAKVNRGSLHLA